MYILDAFLERLEDKSSDYHFNLQYNNGSSTWNRDFECGSIEDMTITRRQENHDAIDSMTGYLVSHSDAIVLEVVAAHLDQVVALVQDPTSQLSTINSMAEDVYSGVFINEYFNNVRPRVLEAKDKQGNAPSDKLMTKRDSIWKMLVYRMLLWLSIHDFDANDVNIVPHHHKGSRVPIYIG